VSRAEVRPRRIGKSIECSRRARPNAGSIHEEEVIRC
jgi:hypothetical protein